MSDTRKKIKEELLELVQFGRHVFYHEALVSKKLTKDQIDTLNGIEEYIKYKKQHNDLKTSYNKWYSKSVAVVNQILPDRAPEFKKLYSDDKRGKDISYLNYSISDYLIGLRITRGWEKTDVVDAFLAFASKIEQQIAILDSCIDRISSRLSDIEGILQAELFDNELEIAKDMLKKHHNRLAGSLAGITLEIHLKKVCKNHNLSFRKAHPTISDFNEELRKNEFIDVPTWRLIQRLGDIRNMSVHSKDREPTNDEVEDLIRGCQKLIAELF